ncbi:hypothetical protein FRACA_410023 [Frankia canadensis]|uniref:Uncharacterized protein n=1 Tax=Frankia canadensis TaxID=1836972 RepID=A0A2I2KWW0_9ACTN|nr:hypothetical protein FRACA_410023 [Frankia canadensis]SOU57439.1 hypothetical protein FRACA_410023 [Frankia canadensis]
MGRSAARSRARSAAMDTDTTIDPPLGQATARRSTLPPVVGPGMSGSGVWPSPARPPGALGFGVGAAAAVVAGMTRAQATRAQIAAMPAASRRGLIGSLRRGIDWFAYVVTDVRAVRFEPKGIDARRCSLRGRGAPRREPHHCRRGRSGRGGVAVFPGGWRSRYLVLAVRARCCRASESAKRGRRITNCAT